MDPYKILSFSWLSECLQCMMFMFHFHISSLLVLLVMTAVHLPTYIFLVIVLLYAEHSCCLARVMLLYDLGPFVAMLQHPSIP